MWRLLSFFFFFFFNDTATTEIYTLSLHDALPISLCSPAIFRTMLVSEDGFDGLEIERGTAAVDERLKHLLHVPAHLKDQVATVFDLIVGVLIMEPATLLFVEVEAEAPTAVNPTLPALPQP